MSISNIETKVENLLQNIIENIGYELYDVQYVKEGKDFYLRIVIDKEDGIDLNDCEKVNDAINDILDEADYIKDQYFLEVSSPGLERTLRKDRRFGGAKKFDIKYNKCQDGTYTKHWKQSCFID